MPTSRDRAISLSFSDALSVLMEACNVPPWAHGAFKERVRHLQRLGLPMRTPDQKMSRLPYGIAELAALATAFRLMGAFMMPMVAVRYVNERWSVLMPFLLAGAHDVVPQEYLLRRPVRGGTLAVFEGNALAEIGQKDRLGEGNGGTLGTVTIVDGDALNILSMAQGSGLVLDSRAYMPIIVRRSVALMMATDAELATELDRLRFDD